MILEAALEEIRVFRLQNAYLKSTLLRRPERNGDRVGAEYFPRRPSHIPYVTVSRSRSLRVAV
jgi:hypothetical protein